MQRLLLIVIMLGTCNILAAMHITVEFEPEHGLILETPCKDEVIIIKTDIEEVKDGFIKFIITVSENPETKDGMLRALSKNSFGQLEIFDGNKKLAEIKLEGKFFLDKEREFEFEIHKDLLEKSLFTFRTYPVSKNDNIHYMHGINFELHLIKFYKAHLDKIQNKNKDKDKIE